MRHGQQYRKRIERLMDDLPAPTHKLVRTCTHTRTENRLGFCTLGKCYESVAIEATETMP